MYQWPKKTWNYRNIHKCSVLFKTRLTLRNTRGCNAMNGSENVLFSNAATLWMLIFIDPTTDNWKYMHMDEYKRVLNAIE